MKEAELLDEAYNKLSEQDKITAMLVARHFLREAHDDNEVYGRCCALIKKEINKILGR